LNTLVQLRQEWFGNIRGDLLAGLVVALALIPEAIAFSIIAGVDPKVGLYASFCIAVVISFTGGRPGMISAATGAMALLMVVLVKEHGLQYLLAATLLTGVPQILAGLSTGPRHNCARLASNADLNHAQRGGCGYRPACREPRHQPAGNGCLRPFANPHDDSGQYHHPGAARLSCAGAAALIARG
jgi:hypothetical protein